VSEPEADQDAKGDEIGDERVGEARKPVQEFLIGLGVKSFPQLDIDDQQRHREGEDRIGQCLEPACWDETGRLYRL
jgi:hypothetical protein